MILRIEGFLNAWHSLTNCLNETKCARIEILKESSLIPSSWNSVLKIHKFYYLIINLKTSVQKSLHGAGSMGTAQTRRHPLWQHFFFRCETDDDVDDWQSTSVVQRCLAATRDAAEHQLPIMAAGSIGGGQRGASSSGSSSAFNSRVVDFRSAKYSLLASAISMASKAGESACMS